MLFDRLICKLPDNALTQRLLSSNFEGISPSSRTARIPKPVPFCCAVPARTFSRKSRGISRYTAKWQLVLLFIHPRAFGGFSQQDATCVARNVLLDPRLCPGGGATEMTISQALREKSKSIEGVEQWPYIAVANALEVIPRYWPSHIGPSARVSLIDGPHAERWPRTAARVWCAC